jgi:hypothetical protein
MAEGAPRSRATCQTCSEELDLITVEDEDVIVPHMYVGSYCPGSYKPPREDLAAQR